MKNNLEQCRACQNRKFDPEKGLVCGLTMEKPAFEEEKCPQYLADKVVINKTKEKKKEKKREEKEERRMGRIILIISLVFFAGRVSLKLLRNNRIWDIYDKKERIYKTKYDSPLYDEFVHKFENWQFKSSNNETEQISAMIEFGNWYNDLSSQGQELVKNWAQEEYTYE